MVFQIPFPRYDVGYLQCHGKFMVRGAQHLLRIVQFGAVHAEHIHCVRFGRAIQDNIIEGVDGLKIIWEGDRFLFF